MGPHLIQKTEEAGDRSCDPWIGSLACYPQHYRRFSFSKNVSISTQKTSVILKVYLQIHYLVFKSVTKLIVY